MNTGTGFWSALSTEDRRRLMLLAETRSYDPGQILVTAGRRSEHVLVLLEGWAKAVLRTQDTEPLLHIYGPHSLIGFPSADPVLHTHTVVALSPIRALLVDCDLFGTSALSSRVTTAMVADLRTREHNMEQRVLNLSNGDGNQRIIRLLNDLAERTGITHPDRSVSFPFPVTQQNLVSWSGTSRATVGRALSSLRRKGIIGAGRRLTVLMPEKLARKAAALVHVAPPPPSRSPAEEPQRGLPYGTLQFEVLGQFRAHMDGTEIDLGPPKSKLILAILILAEGSPVSHERLMEHLWGGNIPGSATTMLYSYVSGLRRSLESGADFPVSIDYLHHAYVLQVADEQVDVVRFRGLVAASNGLSDHIRAAQLLDSALRLWGEGTVLAGVAGKWAAGRRRQLEEEHNAAFLSFCDVKLRLGHHRELIPRLVRHIRGKEPLNEALTQRLMLAYHRAGRTAEALAAYHEIRDTLDKELGLFPGMGLQELYTLILGCDPALDAITLS
ncbi:BTAD domain-containing putative transcriptional regulator [Nonomuraea typhae]|uniref:BTAD domain-containing putative transcriptional regulator n=1 Tax=Nonomuraea typhae TaxID=2603600 RepID=UPI0012F95A5B|nr:BTAD domain-containing putative transcriptional regulator [Nonomuraea typhae]